MKYLDINANTNTWDQNTLCQKDVKYIKETKANI